MLQYVTFLLGGFFDVDRHDCHTESPGSEIYEHSLVVVEEDRRHSIAAPQAQALAHDGGGPFHQLAEAGVTVHPADRLGRAVTLVVIGQEGLVGTMRAVDAHIKELGKGTPG